MTPPIEKEKHGRRITQLITLLVLGVLLTVLLIFFLKKDTPPCEFTTTQFDQPTPLSCVDYEDLPCTINRWMGESKINLAPNSLKEDYYVCLFDNKLFKEGKDIVMIYNNPYAQRIEPITWLGWQNTTQEVKDETRTEETQTAKEEN